MAINQMPHNLDAEAALLGCILIDGDIQSDLLEQLKEEDFYQPSHQDIFLAMRAIFASRKTVDVVTLTDRLDRDGKLDKIGGIQYVTELAQLTPSAANYRQYADIVKRDSTNRALIRAANSIIENSLTAGDERAALAFAEKQVYDLSSSGEASALEGMGDGRVIQEVIQKFESISADPNAFRGLETGFKHLDRITNGLQKSDLIILAARPGVGKTSFAMNIVENSCLLKKKVAAVFSLEMPRVQLVQRLLCAHAGVSMEKALKGDLKQKDWKNLMRASDNLQKSRIHIDDSSRITPAEILSKCRRLKAKEGSLDLVMIDYIQLMGGEDEGKKGRSAENRQQEIASITRNLKIMAKELNVPVIALSQLRRIETKEPQLSDLRESGAIEQDADIVMFINRPDVSAKEEDLKSGKVVKGAAEITLAKHRNGSLGRIQLRFLGESTKFIDVDAQGAPEEEPQYRKKTDFGDNPEADDVFPEPPPEEDTGIPA